MKKLLFLVTALAVVIAVLALGTSPATAAGSSDRTTVTADTVSTVPVSRHNGRHPHKPPLSQIKPYYLSSSYCGYNIWTGPRYCINFSRTEQLYISDVSIAVAAVFICTRGVWACAVATAVAITAIRYLDNRGGICPSYNPILEVEYAPHPGGYAKCSDG
jgi:hypothetical protein